MLALDQIVPLLVSHLFRQIRVDRFPPFSANGVASLAKNLAYSTNSDFDIKLLPESDTALSLVAMHQQDSNDADVSEMQTETPWFSSSVL